MTSENELVVQTSIAKWERERCGFFSWEPNKKLLMSIRDYDAFKNSGLFEIPIIGALMKVATILRHRFWSVTSGADIQLNSSIGGGLLIPHSNGIVIHPNAQIGINCLMMSQVVLGTTQSQEAPIIGSHVDIGTGAKILGNISIGDYAKIGANAVVLAHVPPGATAVGVPAKIIARNSPN